MSDQSGLPFNRDQFRPRNATKWQRVASGQRARASCRSRDVDDAARVLWIERAKTRAGDRRLEVPEVLRPQLAALVAGRAPDAPLFGGHDRHWVGYHVRRLCRLAKVPVVCPHVLRGTQSSIAARAVPVGRRR
jgi:integrase